MPGAFLGLMVEALPAAFLDFLNDAFSRFHEVISFGKRKIKRLIKFINHVSIGTSLSVPGLAGGIHKSRLPLKQDEP